MPNIVGMIVIILRENWKKVKADVEKAKKV
jgi:hypothetical protein